MLSFYPCHTPCRTHPRATSTRPIAHAIQFPGAPSAVRARLRLIDRVLPSKDAQPRLNLPPRPRRFAGLRADIRAVLAGTLVAAVLWASCCSAPRRMRRARRPASAATLMIDGAGDGHGVGMSQEGALGYAEHGFVLRRDPRPLLHGHRARPGAGGNEGASAGRQQGQDAPAGKLRARRGLRRDARQLAVAALEAQAVASRTYALTAARGRRAVRRLLRHALADVSRQVRGNRRSTNARSPRPPGRSSPTPASPRSPTSSPPAAATPKTSQDAFPGAAAEPWLVGVADPYDQGPEHSWKQSLSFAAASSAA